MASLWSSSSAAAWTAAWSRYAAVLASLEKDDLEALDEWFQAQLPGQLHGRDPRPFLTHAELTRLMQWKLKKGKWRPQLMKFIQGLTPSEVKKASTEAFKALKDGELKAAVEAMSALKGVGPATASAVLAAYDPEVPFMGDEALEAIAKIIGARKYTLAHYLSFVEQMKTKAAWLKTELDSDEWTAQRVQLCLYAATHDSKPLSKPGKKKAAPASKRKAAAAASTTAKEGDAARKEVGQEKEEEEETPRALRKRRRAS